MNVHLKIKNSSALISLFFISALLSPVYAADKKELALLYAAENIEIASQQITKAYFYKHQEIDVVNAKKDLKTGLLSLNRHIKTLATGLTSDDEKNLLLFMSFTRDELKDTVKQPYSKENGALMLDFSESLLEGAESIANRHFDKTDRTLVMLVNVEKMVFLLERITKYYIASRAGFKDENNVKQLTLAVSNFQKRLKILSKYKYPDTYMIQVKKLTKYWPIAKKFYLGVEKNELPLIVSISTSHMEKSLHKLERFHETLAKR